MKFANVLAAVSTFLLLNVVLLPNAAAAEQTAPAKTSEAAYDCKTSKAKVTTCKRPVSQELRKQCRWKCSTSCPGGQCVEVCRGSGQECNGKSPPGW
ncbi:MAG: hypothetical protein HZC23_10315 [Rhodocyclales bacterium]|nr:hypothetical protein [Rhodocyclales bacterium]